MDNKSQLVRKGDAGSFSRVAGLRGAGLAKPKSARRKEENMFDSASKACQEIFSKNKPTLLL
jgi:hypothetical protein